VLSLHSSAACDVAAINPQTFGILRLRPLFPKRAGVKLRHSHKRAVGILWPLSRSLGNQNCSFGGAT
jgi:hypothetical protein